LGFEKGTKNAGAFFRRPRCKKEGVGGEGKASLSENNGPFPNHGGGRVKESSKLSGGKLAVPVR
jgi:hypothetical protein